MRNGVIRRYFEPARLTYDGKLRQRQPSTNLEQWNLFELIEVSASLWECHDRVPSTVTVTVAPPVAIYIAVFQLECPMPILVSV
jgi:hypothetical protein